MLSCWRAAEYFAVAQQEVGLAPRPTATLRRQGNQSRRRLCPSEASRESWRERRVFASCVRTLLQGPLVAGFNTWQRPVVRGITVAGCPHK
eukprot:353839-Chlamydomonas_euryale.AAC.41